MAGVAGSTRNIIVQGAEPSVLDRVRTAVAAQHGTVTAELPIIDGFAATVTSETDASLRAWSASTTGVQVWDDRTVTLEEPMIGGFSACASATAQGAFSTTTEVAASFATATSSIGLPDMWSRGLQGRGVGIAVLDTGVAPHRDLASRITAFKDLVNNQEQPYDDRGHGTHVASLAAGDGTMSAGKYRGAAPKADIIGVKVMDARGQGQLSTIIAGIGWAVEHREQHNIRIMNLSLGAPQEVVAVKDPLVQACQRANQAGILVVAAAGNHGPYPNTIDTPAVAPEVLAVGATMDYQTISLDDDKVAWFSGTGPTKMERRVKPDVVAPGTQVVCADPSGKYVFDTGTSMAAPLVAGAAALILEARPDTTPGQLREVLMGSAYRLDSVGPNIQGKGVVQPLAALQSLEATVPPAGDAPQA